MCNMIAVLYFATQRWLLRYKFMCQIRNKYSVLYASACQITVIFWEKEMDLTKHIFSLTCMYTQSLTLLIANTRKQTHTCYYISTYWFTHIVVCVCVCVCLIDYSWIPRQLIRFGLITFHETCYSGFKMRMKDGQLLRKIKISVLLIQHFIV